VRQVQRPSCEGSTLPSMLTVCTVKGALMLLFKGATSLETPKHDAVLKVQKTCQVQLSTFVQVCQHIERLGHSSLASKRRAFWPLSVSS
jgi:hypothetical protein